MAETDKETGVKDKAMKLKLKSQLKYIYHEKNHSFRYACWYD